MNKIIKVVIEPMDDGKFGFVVEYAYDDLEIAIDVMKDKGYKTDGIELKKPYVRNGKTWINIHVNDPEKIDMDVLMKRINSIVDDEDRIFKNHIYVEQT